MDPILSRLKMYIFVKAKTGYEIPAIAHAALICHLRFEHDQKYKDWLMHSFKKVICKLEDMEFASAIMSLDKKAFVCESNKNNDPVAIVCCPRFKEELPAFLRQAPLLKINYNESD